MEEKTKKLFDVQGKIKNGKNEKKFLKQVSSLNENTAIEKIFGLFGSKNKIKRRDVEINEVKEVKE
ncbi:MAG: 50S ribosomal protein L18a [Candidatus Diapherotrites archaeon CG_4_10_14_0_2_um_filter_31_5]|nr:MAG: 50S ribosomal protein L18a [Candidatus Diapherotrites archaeon CG_4_10_14_0_2_um_filter_31_5]